MAKWAAEITFCQAHSRFSGENNTNFHTIEFFRRECNSNNKIQLSDKIQ